MYGGGTSGDVPPSVLDGVICVGSIVVVLLRHASASLRGDSLANVAVVSWRRVRTQRARGGQPSEMRYSESNRATTVVCCGGAVRVVMFDILYASVYLKLNVGKWVASVTIELGNLS